MNLEFVLNFIWLLKGRRKSRATFFVALKDVSPEATLSLHTHRLN